MSNIDLRPTQSDPTLNEDKKSIPLCVPEIRGNEWKYIKECLDSGWVSSVGSYVDRFEADLASYLGIDYAVACVNGTAALHTALLVAGIGVGDEVFVSDLTFISPVNAIKYTGASPIFIDAEPDFYQMDPNKISAFIEKHCRFNKGLLINQISGKTIKGIIPVHILGHPVNMDPILDIAHQYNLVVIEDATESLGSMYKNKNVGTMGDIACFSFNGNKLITTGGGGMIATNNEDWAKKARYLTTQAKDNPLEFIHNQVGYNYRLTNIQAAMGVAQLEMIEDYIKKKRRIAGIYSDAFKNIPGIKTMVEAPWAFSVFWMYTILIDEKVYRLSSRGLLEVLSKNKIQSRPLWQPMNLSPTNRDNTKEKFPIADSLYEKALSIPCSVGLTENQQNSVISIIQQGVQ